VKYRDERVGGTKAKRTPQAAEVRFAVLALAATVGELSPRVTEELVEFVADGSGDSNEWRTTSAPYP